MLHITQAAGARRANEPVWCLTALRLSSLPFLFSQGSKAEGGLRPKETDFLGQRRDQGS